MGLLTTEAIVLSSIRYGETSKIVRLATRDAGVLSAIAKGALRPRSRFGAALQVLSRGQAHLLPSRTGDLYQLTAFDLLHLPAGLGEGMARYTGAAALTELVQRITPAESHPEVFEALQAGLEALEAADPDRAGVLTLQALWRVVSLLGFEPALDACVFDGIVISPGQPLPFSAREGGALCEACARTHAVRVLPAEDRATLTALVHGRGPPPDLDSRHERAHRRLAAQFIRHQLAEGSDLPALEVWEGQGWEPPR
ncbi:MAG TPA: DNA repair protein RecO [Gemmatimonadales bacterium]